jgi:hypothetical protein
MNFPEATKVLMAAAISAYAAEPRQRLREAIGIVAEALNGWDQARTSLTPAQIAALLAWMQPEPGPESGS